MRRAYILFCTFLLTSITVFSKKTLLDNKLFVTEGRTWISKGYLAISPDYGKDKFETKYFFQGDSIIDGIKYKCLYSKVSYVGGEKRCKLVYLLRQEEDKVYTHKGNILYEFGLNVGESSQNGWQVTAVGDTILNDGIQRRFLKVKYQDTEHETTFATDIWIEGIGSLKTGIEKDNAPSIVGSSTSLQSVSQYGKYIYHVTKGETYALESTLAENKLWHCAKVHLGSGEIQNRFYYAKGDTVINGIIAKKFYLKYSKDCSIGDYQAAMYEDGDRIYYCLAGDTTFCLLYDYGLKMGERVNIEDVPYRIIGADYITLNGKELRRVHLQPAKGEGSTIIWTEGFGSLVNPISEGMILPGSYESFQSCEIDNQVVINREDMEIPLTYISWIGAVWSYLSYEKNKSEFIRYTVLDDPQIINGNVYFPLVRYTSCEYQKEKEERRWHIRQENNFVYVLKKDLPEYDWEKSASTEERVILNETDDDYVLYDFNYVQNKVYGLKLNPDNSLQNIFMTDTSSVSIREGHIHRVITLDGGTSWIDGIGNIGDLMYPYPISSNAPTCVCGIVLNYFRSADKSIVYYNPFQSSEYDRFNPDDCALDSITSVSIGTINEQAIHLQVNGSTLFCTSPNAVKLDVYTMDAVKVGEASFINGEAVVKVNKTPATYLYIVTYPDGRRESGKVVVK